VTYLLRERSITRSKLEYPTADVSFAFLTIIDKTLTCQFIRGVIIGTRDSFADKAVFGGAQVNQNPSLYARYQDYNNSYDNILNPVNVGTDHQLEKIVAGSITALAKEAVDINASRGEG